MFINVIIIIHFFIPTQPKNKFQKKYGNTKTRTFEYKLALFKHNLKATCTKFKYSKRKHQCKTINRSFSKDPKGVYKNFRETKVNVENLPSKYEVESFWKSIWCKNVTFNKDALWISDLVVNYFKDSIDLKTLNTDINKINLSKAPGRDLIIGFRQKKLDYYRENFVTLLQNTLNEENYLSDWSSLAKTTLTPKNENTHSKKTTNQ